LTRGSYCTWGCWIQPRFDTRRLGQQPFRGLSAQVQTLVSDAPRKEIPRPKEDDDFEDLVLALYRAVWQDPNAKLHGRSGQGQEGIDLYGEDRFGAQAQWRPVQAARLGYPDQRQGMGGGCGRWSGWRGRSGLHRRTR
jgi:hypothetical protein